MHHHRQGSGSPIVLVHGIGSRWQVWRPILDRLAEHHDVIALDLPGFGGTPDDGAPGSVPHLADRVAAFAEAGVSTLNAHPLGEDHDTRLRTVALLKGLVS